MKDRIKPKNSYRFMYFCAGDSYPTPGGDFMYDDTLESTLESRSGSPRDFVINIQTKEKVYEWDEKSAEWVLAAKPAVGERPGL
jgi:hypothetical protein